MAVTDSTPKKPSILFIMDDRLSREKLAILRRVTTLLRETYSLEVLNDPVSESDLLTKLETTKPYDLVLAPWHRYAVWNRIENYFGLNRLGGATFAGYFAENLKYSEFVPRADQFRGILLDFANTAVNEILLLIRSLITEVSRTGLIPILEKNALVYCDSWSDPLELGRKMDSLIATPEYFKYDWGKRSTAVRIVFQSLWTMAFGEVTSAPERIRAAKGYFQSGADGNILALRLICPVYKKTPREMLLSLWPDPNDPFSATQLLVKYADAVRVHPFNESSEMEVTALFFKSAPSELANGKFQTLWIDPISAKSLNEAPFEMPHARAPHLKKFPAPSYSVSETLNEAKNTEEKLSQNSDDKMDAKNRLVLQAAAKIKELAQLLVSRDELIQELRSGGVSTAPALPAPDADALLEAFQQKYFETRYQIRQFEIQIQDIEKNGANPEQIELLRLKIAKLHAQETNWVKKLAITIETYRAAKKKA